MTQGITLRDRLADGRIHLMDGAMGTVLYERGVFVNVCYDELSLTEAALVEEVHRAYVEAGARLIETNTFGANPVKLSSFGLEGQVRRINRSAGERARGGIASANLPPGAEPVHVLGAMGPLGIRIEPWGPTAEEEARGYFARQVEGLLEGGVDGFILETFQDLRELGQAFRAVREASDLPVIAQVTIESGGRTSYGTEVEEVTRRLESWGVDAVGVNCSVGPAEILDAVERMTAVTRLPVAASPNAGLPRTVGDRKMYMASPEYMARYARRMAEAGARLLGGCCGTNPEHIRRIGEALEDLDEGPLDGAKSEASVSPKRDRVRRDLGNLTRGFGRTQGVTGPPGTDGHRVVAADSDEPPAHPLGERSPLGRRLAEGEFVTSVELVPPRGWDPEPLVAEARRVRLAGVDVVSLPDTPRGRARMGSLPAGLLLGRETGLDVLVHYACRDRNMLGMISDLLGAAAAGIRNVLVITGDLSPTGPYPDHTAVLDIDSIGLTNVLHHLNRGRDPGGHPVEPSTPFVIGVALHQAAGDLEREHRRFRWKVEAGAEFAVTQPIFDPDALHDFLDRAFGEEVDAEAGGGASGGDRIPVLAGLWPLDSVRTAEFLHNEIPGVQVPEDVVERMREAEAQGADAALEAGVQIAVEGATRVRDRIQGIHVASPRGRLELALEVVRRLRGLGVSAAVRPVASPGVRVR